MTMPLQSFTEAELDTVDRFGIFPLGPHESLAADYDGPVYVGPEQDEPELVDAPTPKCPDDGACHHGCTVDCWRVTNAGPLSGVFPGNQWPDWAKGEQLDDDLTGNPDGVGVIADLADLPSWISEGVLQEVLTNAAEAEPLVAFVALRLLDIEHTLEAVAKQKHLHWVEPFTAARSVWTVEATRQLLSDHLVVHQMLGDQGPCDCHTIRCLAWPWQDHPDWQAEWRI